MWGGLLVRVAKKACTGGGVYICVKLPSEDLNYDSYPPYPTSTYTCGVTIAPRVHGDRLLLLFTNLYILLSIFLKKKKKLSNCKDHTITLKKNTKRLTQQFITLNL